MLCHRLLMGVFNLSQNLIFADDHGIQPAGHFKQMMFRPRPVIKPQHAADVMGRADSPGKHFPDPFKNFPFTVFDAAVRINFRTVACGDHYTFFD